MLWLADISLFQKHLRLELEAVKQAAGINHASDLNAATTDI